MSLLYPLLFHPTPVERIWGGNFIAKKLHPQFPSDILIGESWELSGLQDFCSVVRNGFLSGNDINELIEVYLGDLIGDSLFQRYGSEFPLMVKILDINDYLSFQVHPSNEIAATRHNAYGKAEAWYILSAEADATIFIGFNRQMNEAEFRKRVINQTLPEVMNQCTPQTGDLFYIPPGTVHSAGGGLQIIEIQQLSDVTYRIYDWGREFLKESAREMHLELGIDVINWETSAFSPTPKEVNQTKQTLNTETTILKSPYFYLSTITLSAPIHLSNRDDGSFRLLICTEGEVEIHASKSFALKKGEVTLIPAVISNYSIEPKKVHPQKENKEFYAKLLEVWIE